ncbi:hypothetical protein GGTG_09026 [Gaeumannomyces tritici R3-111a-1]|uniref:PWI domain-containing protein n=1 Tax=Gaeumannomyces tritici (strain R3-111a-1) TaxID=644352 RepID=J3P685_GAET3|nr:hypothetical protein GGTG_09026 [Gaeumannomyces tritici R3-111a-1]EJT72159.1 hypothetical protein GGTG_09026 [Gaeumannomyces tritici R3-111a-1]
MSGYSPYGGRPPPHYALPNYPGFPPVQGAGGPPGMIPPPGLGPPPGMSSAPGMAPPPGMPPPNNNPQANRPSGLPGSFQPPANLPNINFNAPVIRLGGPNLPNKPNVPAAGAGGGRGFRGEPDTPVSASGDHRAGDGDREPRDRDRGARGGGGRETRHPYDRGLEQARANVRESMQNLISPTVEDKLRTVFVRNIPEGVCGEVGLQKILNSVGRLKRWDSAKSQMEATKGHVFGFAQYEDFDALATAVELLRNLRVPAKKQEPTDGAGEPAGAKEDTKDQPMEDVKKEANGEQQNGDDADNEKAADEQPAEEDLYPGIDKVVLRVTVDEATIKSLDHHRSTLGDDGQAKAKANLESARARLKEVVHDLFRPSVKAAKDSDGDVAMRDAAASGDVEVISIPLAQDDELAEIPPEMREVVAAEIAAFRERSNQRDQERLKREEELEEQERQRSNGGRALRVDSPPAGSNQTPIGPRVLNAPSGPRGQNGTSRRDGRDGVAFVNGGAINGDGQYWRDDDDTDASDEELHQRELSKQKADDDKLYNEAERKWANRERARQAALDREQERDRGEAENAARRKTEQLERDRGWDDEREASRKSHLYYRDRGAWARKRAQELGEERTRDDADRRAEAEERRREERQMEQAKGMADSFLEQQEREMLPAGGETVAGGADGRPESGAPAAAPQRFTISLGAAAQKAQTQRAAPARRTFAEVEGLLDDEEADGKTRRQLIPIKFEPLSAGQIMTEEEVQKAVRSLAQEIPTDKDGLWAWEVQWDHMEESIIQEKLRPFVEKKVVEYLGVQEEILVEVVMDHLRKHGKPAELVEELEGALDEDGEDLVKKLWRMVIFFTESEKRGLPA